MEVLEGILGSERSFDQTDRKQGLVDWLFVGFCWSMGEILFGNDFCCFQEGFVFYENRCLFEMCCFTLARSSLLPGRGAPGESRDRPKRAKRGLGEVRKSDAEDQ